MFAEDSASPDIASVQVEQRFSFSRRAARKVRFTFSSSPRAPLSRFYFQSFQPPRRNGEKLGEKTFSSHVKNPQSIKMSLLSARRIRSIRAKIERYVANGNASWPYERKRASMRRKIGKYISVILVSHHVGNRSFLQLFLLYRWFLPAIYTIYFVPHVPYRNARHYFHGSVHTIMHFLSLFSSAKIIISEAWCEIDGSFFITVAFTDR